MKLLRISFVIFLTISTYQNGFSQKLKIEKPINSTDLYSSQHAESIIFLPIKLELKSLTNIIKKETPKKFSGKLDGIHDGKYKVKLSSISHNVKNKNYRLDGRFKNGSAEGTLGVKIAGETIGVGAKIDDLRGHVYIEPRLSFDNYKIKTNLFMDSKVDNAKLKACKKVNLIIGSETICSPGINVTGIIKGDIEHQINKSKTGIEETLKEEFNKIELEKKTSDFWKSLHSSLPLDSTSNPFWLNIQPSEILIENINYDKKYMNLGVGLKATTQLSSKKSETTPLPLPKPTAVNSNQKGFFNVSLNNKVSYKRIEQFLKDSLKNYVIEYNEKPTLKIKDYQVHGTNGGKLIIGLKIKGLLRPIKKVKGWLYLESSLAFDETKRLLFVEDYTIESNTKKFIVDKGIELIGNKIFYKKILAKLQYSIKDDVDDGLKSIDEYLRNGINTSFGSLKGSCNLLELKNLILSKEYIHVDLLLKGGFEDFEVKLEELMK